MGTWIVRIFTSQPFFWLSILSGIACGLNFRDFSESLKPFADMYISFLRLSVIPVIIITVTAGLARITSHINAKDIVWRVFTALFGLMLIAAVLSTAVGFMFAPGVGLSQAPEIASIINQSEHGIGPVIGLNEVIQPEISPGFGSFLLGIVPSNIFHALSEGAILQVIVFSIIFGAAIGFKRRQDHIDRITYIQSFQPVFTLINDTVLAFLPFGVFFLLASQFSHFEFRTIFILGRLVLALCLSMTLLIFLFIGIIWFYSGRPFLTVMKSLGYITVMAVSTRSTFACIPKAIENMSRFFDEDTTNLVIPFGNTTCHFGSVCFFTIGTLFIANLFVASLSWYSYLTIIFSAILASLASSGAVGILSIQMITIVLDPLGLPLGTVLALFVAIDPIVDVFDTVANVFGNCAATAISSGPLRRVESLEEEIALQRATYLREPPPERK